MMKLLGTVSLFFAALTLTGCMFGPHYQRPVALAPPVYRGAAAVSANVAGTSVSAGDRKWSEVFQDREMTYLIAEALKNNYDVRIAAQRVLELQAQVGIVRAQSLPTVSGGASYNAIGLPAGLLGTTTSSTFHGGGFTAAAAWNLDFWGLYRKQTEAARAELLATEWGRRATLSSVVMNVAASFLQLRTLDTQLLIAHKIVASKQESLRLVRLRESVGRATRLDIHQAEQMLLASEASIPNIERQIEVQENHISLLLGRNPGPIARGDASLLHLSSQDLPPGIPSDLLERRPDIQMAEAQLIAANARIGVARARFFPQVSITGIGGTATSQFDKLFNSNSQFWFGAVTVSQPLFEGGKLKNNLRLSEATKQEKVLAYQQAIAAAFGDVSNALVSCRRAKEYRATQNSERIAAKKSDELTRILFDNGRGSLTDVLKSHENLYSAEWRLSEARNQEDLALVQLYGALGGGWM
jgi:multidrug efflux system outer membrane protein